MQDDDRAEEKGDGAFAVHYRRATDEAAAVAALEQWAAAAPSTLEPVWGKRVVELRPRGISKGAAVARLAAAHPDRTPVYVGDDVTDEDAFAVLGSGDVGIKSGEGTTAASYRVRGPEQVAHALLLLADLRAE